MKMAGRDTVRLRLGFFVVALVLTQFVPGGKVSAVEFELKKGTQFELCQDMAANLKAFPDLLPQPFDMPFDPSLKDFRWVEWESLDPLGHVEVLRQAAISMKDFRGKMGPEEREAVWQEEKSGLLEKAREGKVSIGQALFDVNHDGNPERVYRFADERFVWPASYDPKGWTYAWTLIVLPEDDPKASRQLSSYVNRPLSPFYYKGRIFYFSASGPSVYEPDEVREIENLNLRNVCNFSIVSK